VITTLRQPTFPAASAARTVTELFPTMSGIAADQAVVPEATPAWPKFVAQDTSATPTLSLAMPAIVTEAAVVDMVPDEGDVMVKLGAVVSVLPLPGLVGVVLTDCRVALTAFDIWLPPAEAVTVIVLAPTASATLAMLQAAVDPAAIPDAPPLEDHVTLTTPVPPDADPDRLTLDAVVVEATAFTVSDRGEPGGGGAVVEVCAAYIVKIAALSGAPKVVTIL
jgi:hypothetical protein